MIAPQKEVIDIIGRHFGLRDETSFMFAREMRVQGYWPKGSPGRSPAGIGLRQVAELIAAMGASDSPRRGVTLLKQIDGLTPLATTNDVHFDWGPKNIEGCGPALAIGLRADSPGSSARGNATLIGGSGGSVLGGKPSVIGAIECILRTLSAVQQPEAERFVDRLRVGNWPHLEIEFSADCRLVSISEYSSRRAMLPEFHCAWRSDEVVGFASRTGIQRTVNGASLRQIMSDLAEYSAEANSDAAKLTFANEAAGD